MSFRLVPKSASLNDLERRNGRYFCVISANSGSFRAHCLKVHVRYLISWWVLVSIVQTQARKVTFVLIGLASWITVRCFRCNISHYFSSMASRILLWSLLHHFQIGSHKTGKVNSEVSHAKMPLKSAFGNNCNYRVFFHKVDTYRYSNT